MTEDTLSHLGEQTAKVFVWISCLVFAGIVTGWVW